MQRIARGAGMRLFGIDFGNREQDEGCKRVAAWEYEGPFWKRV